MIRAICFDLGGTLWDDYPSELHHWELLCDVLAGHGVRVSLEDMIAQAHSVIETFCPSLTRSMVFRLLGGDVEKTRVVFEDLSAGILELFKEPAEFMRLNPLFPGVHDLLARLSSDFKLAVVSQNYAEAEHWMEYHGIGRYFQHLSLSYKQMLFKPDPRLYVLTCEALGVMPTEAVMVGDRLDNDIWPANRLRMTTVRVLAEPYWRQRPRYPNDVPDYTIKAVAEVAGLAESWLSARN